MFRFKRRPVTVEAVQFGSDYGEAKLPSWWYDAIRRGTLATSYDDKDQAVLLVQTNAGRVVAEEGDWIVLGVAGELHPVKPTIFSETYEAAP